MAYQGARPVMLLDSSPIQKYANYQDYGLYMYILITVFTCVYKTVGVLIYKI